MAAPALNPSAWADVTEALRGACAGLTGGGLVGEPDFALADAMNAVELMDAKLDSRAHRPALRPVAELLADGSLPVAALSLREAAGVMDKLLQLHASWLSGNSVPQSLLQCLYAHPVALQSMRRALGVMPYRPSAGPDFRVGMAPAAVAAMRCAPARDEPGVALLPALASGSASRAAVAGVLAFTTALLKCCGLSHRAVFAADLFGEEDFYALHYGADLAWDVPLDEVWALLAAAEAALDAALPAESAAGAVVVAAAVAAAASLPAEKQDSPPIATAAAAQLRALAVAPPAASGAAVPAAAGGGKGGKSSGKGGKAVSAPPATAAAAPVRPPGGGDPAAADADTGSLALALLARLRLARTLLGVAALLSYDARAEPVAPLRWGGSYDLPAVAFGTRAGDALLRVVQASSSLLAAPPSGSGSVAPPPVPTAPDGVPGIVPGYEKLWLTHHTRSSPHPALPAVVPLWREHLSATHALTQLPALASHNPCRRYFPRDIVPAPPPPARLASATSLGKASPFAGKPGFSGPEVDRVTAGAYAPATVPLRALAAAAAAMAPPAAEAGVVVRPLVDVPDSGIEEPPLDWPGAAPSAAPRRHVSLLAVLRALDRVSQRAPDIVVRSWMACVLLELPHHHPAAAQAAAAAAAQADADAAAAASSAAASTPLLAPAPPPQPQPPAAAATQPANPAEPTYLDEYADWSTAHARSGVVFGSHTLQELLRVSLLDGGVHPELLASADGRRFVYMLDRVLQNLLCTLCRSRLRARRTLDAQFRDWNVVLAEARYIDELYGQYLVARCAEADEAVTLGSAPTADGPKGWVAAVAAAAGKPPPPSGSPTAGVPVSEHRHLHVMQVAAPLQASLTTWATAIVRGLQALHTCVGAEQAMFHPDELASMYWHLEASWTQAKRRADVEAALPDALAGVPEMRSLTAHARTTLAAGRQLSIQLLPLEPPPVAQAPEGDSEGGDASASTAADARAGVDRGGADDGEARAQRLARLRELLEGWRQPAQSALQRLFAPGHPGAPSRPPSRGVLLAESQQQLCCGLLRLLVGGCMLQLYRGLRLHVPPERAAAVRALRGVSVRSLPDVAALLLSAPYHAATLAAPSPCFRSDGRMYTQRWRDVNLVPEAPMPQWEEYVDNCLNTPVSKARAAHWLGEAARQLKAAQMAAAGAAALAKAALACDAPALGWAVGGAPSGGGAAARKAGLGGKGAVGSGGDSGGGDAADALAVGGRLPPACTSWEVLASADDLARAQRLARLSISNAVCVTKLLQGGALLAALPDDGAGSELPNMLDPGVLTWRPQHRLRLDHTVDPVYVVAALEEGALPGL